MLAASGSEVRDVQNGQLQCSRRIKEDVLQAAAIKRVPSVTNSEEEDRNRSISSATNLPLFSFYLEEG